MFEKTRNMFAMALLAGLPVGLLNDGQPLPPLSGATAWINSRLLTSADLRGRVVVVEFWTYTCVNSTRTLPYLRAWAEKYKDKGLVVIGVHTPEFSFEKESNNVQWAVKEMHIHYPVAVDNNYAVWNAFHNEYWPAIYFIDAKGHIRHHQFGEGHYDQSEKVIQQLLTETGAAGVPGDLVPVEATGAEAAADFAHLESPETYLGYQRTQNFSSPGGTVADKRHVYASPGTLRLNQWALSGDWTMGPEEDLLNAGNGVLTYKFHARDLNLIMGPAAPGSKLRYRVLIDGKPPGNAHGVDIDASGNGIITEQRMYQLIREPGSITDRLIEIEFPDAGAEVFDVTFG